MIKKLYERCAEWVTQFRFNSGDPFKRARWRMAGLYFIIGVFITFVVDLFFVDRALRGTLYNISIGQIGQPVESAFHELKYELWAGRSVKLVLLSISAFFLAGITLRPIRRNSDLQKRFISIVSHELRTPLAVQKNSIEVALRKGDTLTREEAISVLQSNLEETNRITDIIQFLISFSNAQGRRKSLRLEPVDLTDVAKNVVTTLGNESKQGKVNLVLQTNGPALVNGNFTALEEMIMNLVKNAISYTPEGGTVTVRVEQGIDKKICLSVADSGIGIAQEDLPNLFEPFYRGKRKSLQSNKNGLGLGLSIVKEIVTLHKAHITVDIPDGGGTIFKILFKTA